MDAFRLMTTFVAVVDAGSFAAAGRKLQLSAPAVTRNIADLEDQLGVRLLTRTTRVVRVTDAGARYAEDCRQILADVEAAEARAVGAEAHPRGTLKLTAPAQFGRLHVMPVIREYLQRYPEVRASCWFLDRVVHMTEEGIDIAVRIGDLPDSSLQAIRVGSVRRVVCAAPSYLEAHGMPQSPSDLSAHSLISSHAVTPTDEWRFGAGDEAAGSRIEPRLTVNTNDAAREAALAGLGITQLISYQVADLVRAGQLVTVLEDFAPPPVPVHLMHREGRYPVSRTRAFLDLAIDRLRVALA